MDIILQPISLQAAGATTNDWIDQVKNRVIYSYDLSTIVSGSAGILDFTKGDSEDVSKKVRRKSSMPFGQHIREAIHIIKGNQ